jgi:hypothetical protein
MKKLVRTAAVQQLIQVERQRLQTLHDQCRARLLQLGPEAAIRSRWRVRS